MRYTFKIETDSPPSSNSQTQQNENPQDESPQNESPQDESLQDENLHNDNSSNQQDPTSQPIGGMECYDMVDDDSVLEYTSIPDLINKYYTNKLERRISSRDPRITNGSRLSYSQFVKQFLHLMSKGRWSKKLTMNYLLSLEM